MLSLKDVNQDVLITQLQPASTDSTGKKTLYDQRDGKYEMLEIKPTGLVFWMKLQTTN